MREASQSISRHLPEGCSDFPCQAAWEAMHAKPCNPFLCPSRTRGGGPGLPGDMACPGAAPLAEICQQLCPPSPGSERCRATPASSGAHSFAAPAPSSSDQGTPPRAPSSAEPRGSRGSLSRLASPAWTDFRARSRQPALSRTSLMSRELLNHFPSRGMSSSTAPELLSAQGHGPTSISAGSVH